MLYGNLFLFLTLFYKTKKSLDIHHLFYYTLKTLNMIQYLVKI